MASPGTRGQYPAYHMQRRVKGWVAIGTANVLEQVVDGLQKHYQPAILNAKEERIWADAVLDLRKAEKRFRKLGKHMLKEEYGGH